MKKVEQDTVKRNLDVRPGDTVKVHILIKEAGKEREQIFEGVVLSVSGSGARKTFTVRKISHGVGVEKIFPVNSPLIKKIDVMERGNARRSKLYYMRKRIGKRSLDVNLKEGFEAIIEEEEVEEKPEKKDEEPAEEKVEKKAEEPAEEKVEKKTPAAEEKVPEAEEKSGDAKEKKAPAKAKAEPEKKDEKKEPKDNKKSAEKGSEKAPKKDPPKEAKK